MSVLDIRVTSSLPRHPKFKKLVKRMGLEALYWLVCLWFFAAEYRQSGVLTDMTSEDIELAIEWTGVSGQFVKILTELRWLDEDEAGVFSLHDWAQWQPWIVGAPERSEAARKAAEARWNEKNAGSKRGASGRDAPGARAAQKGDAPLFSFPVPSVPSPLSPVRDSDNSRLTVAFARFYKAYPRDAGRGRAAEAWRKLKPSPELVERIIEDCRVRFKGVEKRYITKPANYLVQKEWEDEIVLHNESSGSFERRERAIDIAKRRLQQANEEEGNDDQN